MPSPTLAQIKEQDAASKEQNRAVGVVEYTSGEKQVSDVWEVTEGLKYLPGGKVLGPGSRFHPTVRQVEQTRAGRGGLVGKARELTATEYAGIRGSRTMSTGADIGIRALEMTNHALRRALDAKLTEADFEGVVPAGADGQYTKAQVEEIIANRRDLAA